MEMKIKNKKPEVRFLYDMKKVIYEQKWLRKVSNFSVYYMYRGIQKKGELRYDITHIPAKMLGQEFTKTKGHIHNKNFQEVYRVLKGEAIFLMQKSNGKGVEDVFAIKAKRRDIVIVPPFYGHVTINPGKKDLEVANWISKKCQNSYSLFEKRKGACYYFTKRR